MDKKSKDLFDNERFNCFSYHLGKNIQIEFSQKGIIIENSFCYVQCVGTKFSMFTPTVNGIYHSVEKLRYLFDLDSMQCFYDICFSSIAHTCNDSKKVSAIQSR